MMPKHPARAGTRKRKAERTGAGVPAPNKVQEQQDKECRFVDVDPWAVLLKQLMEVPKEATPAERKKCEYGRNSILSA